MWFGKSAYIHEEEGRNFIENREENMRVKRRSLSLSLTTLNSEISHKLDLS